MSEREVVKDIRLELIDDGDSFIDSQNKYRKILVEGPGEFGIILSTSLVHKDNKSQDSSVGNIDIFFPSEIFDKIIDMLGEEYKMHITKDVIDSTTLRIDHKITLVKNEKEVKIFSDTRGKT